MKVTIRDIQENDLKNISQIYVYSWKKAFSKFLLPSTINKLNVEEKEIYLKNILDNNGNIFIAENIKNKEIGGYIIYEKIYNKSIEIISFYISPVYTKYNIGKQLLNHLKIYCNKNYINVVILWTFKNNIDAIAFYKNLGFYETGLQRESKIEPGQIEVQYILK